MTSGRPGGWPATCTGNDGTSSAKRSANRRGPYASTVGSAGRYSLGASNERAVSKTLSHSPVPPRPAASASRSASVPPSSTSATVPGRSRSSSSRGASTTAAANSASETASSGCTPTSGLPSAGGHGTPSGVSVRRRTISPTAIVTAPSANTACGSRRRAAVTGRRLRGGPAILAASCRAAR